jgi:CRISPR/Cas system-associated exonuclease Cas4 (RecB family)
LVKGYSEYNIASELKVSQSTVSRNIVYLRQQDRENLQKHIQERLPQEYENCMTGINRVLQLTWEIAEKPTDDKTKLQAFAQLNEGYKFKMDLTTNGVVIKDAVKYVPGQMDHLNRTEKALPQDIKENKQQEEIEEQKTTNGIF